MPFASVVTVLAEEGGHGDVMLATFPYGLIALVCFAVLAVVTVSYRHVWHRHPGPRKVRPGNEVEHTSGH